MPSCARHAGMPLAAERPAVPRAEPHGQIDRRLLPSTCAARSSASGWVKSGEKQIIDDDLPGLGHQARDRIDVGGARLRKNPS